MASTIMSCEMSGNTTQQHVIIDMEMEMEMEMDMDMDMSAEDMNNHDCCPDDASDECGGNCQCLIGGCSFVYVEPIKAINDAFILTGQSVAKHISSPRTQFLSFLFRPPIV